MPLDDRRDHRLHRRWVAHVAHVVVLGALDLRPRAGDHLRARRPERVADTEPDPAGAAGDQYHPTGQVDRQRHSASLPSKCLVWRGRSSGDGRERLRPDGIRVVTMDAPPVNALTVRGWFELAAALDEASADTHTKVVVLRAEGRGFNAGWTSRRCSRAPASRR